MVFSSLFFIYIFLPLCLLLYYLSPKIKTRNFILMILSLLFYSFGEPVYIIILLFSSVVAFLFAKLIHKNKGTLLGKLFLLISVSTNLIFLIYFKYWGLLIDTVNTVFSLNINIPNVIMPIGISFFTFQILTYTLDVYAEKTEVQHSLVDFLLFVSLFPQLIAGPILRYIDIQKQLDYREHTYERFSGGILYFICGLSKKVLIADYAGQVSGNLLNNLSTSNNGMWLGIILFTFQIYFDFSGYSDMAVGLGKMFGFEYVRNFNYPYISTSVTDFWRRWHMSLGTFFRDYVYIPLGGNRTHQIRNILFVWLLTGIWHGASWNFALWGVYFGVLLIIEKYILKHVKVKIPIFLKWFYCFFIVVIGWVIFYYSDLHDVARCLIILFSFKLETDLKMIQLIRSQLLFVIVCIIAATPIMHNVVTKIISYFNSKKEGLGSFISTVSSSFYILVLLFACTVRLLGSSFSPFLYFRF